MSERNFTSNDTFARHTCSFQPFLPCLCILPVPSGFEPVLGHEAYKVPLTTSGDLLKLDMLEHRKDGFLPFLLKVKLGDFT